MSTINADGYVLIYVGKDHPMADVRGYAYEHRLVAAEKAKRVLLPGEIAHHDDEDRSNNSNNNVILLPSIAAHKLLHRKKGSKLRLPGEENLTIACSCGCGETLLKYDAVGRPRSYIYGHSWRKGTGKRNSKEQVFCACNCGKSFRRFDSSGRERKYISGHNGRPMALKERYGECNL